MRHRRFAVVLGWMLSASFALADDQLGATNKPAAAQPAVNCTFAGRFVLDADPPWPRPQPLPGVNRDNYDKQNLLDESLRIGKEGGIQNIVIWASDKKIPIPPRSVEELPAPAQLTFQGGLFQPRILAYEAWRPLQLSNADPVATNAAWMGLPRGAFNQLIPPGESRTLTTPAQKLPTPVRSNCHPWAKAHLFSCAHPFFAVTDENGDFEIENVPPGTWEFRIWHERFGYLQFGEPAARLVKLKMQPGENNLGVIKVRISEGGDSAKADLNELKRFLYREEQSRADRIESHNRTQAARLPGRWKMTLPRGYVYDIDIVPEENGLLALRCKTNINMLGTYAFADGLLQLVATSHIGVRDFTWSDQDGALVLIQEDHDSGGKYSGARLERQAEK